MVSEHIVPLLKKMSMAKKTSDGEMAAPALTFKLSKTNYRAWSMTMEVYLESHDLWLEITGENILKKKDRLALSAIISAVPKDILMILDAKKMARENWEILWQQNLGVDRVIQSRIQGMKRDFELLTMGKTDLVVDFGTKFTHILSDLRNLGETMDEKDVVRRFLRATPSKFDALTLSLEQYGDQDKVSLDEVIGSLTVHEICLHERESREEEQAVLTKALSKTKLSTEDEPSSRGKGRLRGHGRGRGRGRGCLQNSSPDEDKKKKFDKSTIQCYNCEKYRHFAYECRSKKKERDEHSYVSKSTPAAAAAQSSSSAVIASSSLLMAAVEEASDLLLHGSKGVPSDPTLWYLDRGATNHMTGQREFFCSIDKSTTGFVKFGDDSKIRIEGQGDIEMTHKDGKVLRLSSVIFMCLIYQQTSLVSIDWMKKDVA